MRHIALAAPLIFPRIIVYICTHLSVVINCASNFCYICARRFWGQDIGNAMPQHRQFLFLLVEVCCKNDKT